MWLQLIRKFIFIVAFFFVEGFFAGPGVALYKYYHNQLDSRHLPTLQMSANILNCLLWIIHAQKDLSQVDIELKFACNILGLLFNIIWVIFTWSIYSENSMKENGIYLFATMNIVLQLYLFLDKISSGLIIILSITVNITIYLSLIQHVV